MTQEKEREPFATVYESTDGGFLYAQVEIGGKIVWSIDHEDSCFGVYAEATSFANRLNYALEKIAVPRADYDDLLRHARNVDRENADLKGFKAAHDKVVAEVDRLRKVLNRISGLCGNPDPREACRNVLAEVKESLRD